MSMALMALTYSCTLQMVAVTWRTRCADSFSCATEACSCATMADRMLGRFMAELHCARPSTNRSDHALRIRPTWVSKLEGANKGGKEELLQGMAERDREKNLYGIIIEHRESMYNNGEAKCD